MAARLPLVQITGQVREIPGGDSVPIAAGGTGAIDARTALANLGGSSNNNLVINGDFAIWQRATSQSASGYKSADRWAFIFNTGSCVASLAPFAVGGGEGYDSAEQAVQIVYAGGSGVNDLVYAQQVIEGVQRTSGKTVTLQFRAYSASAQEIALELVQVFGGSSPITGIGSQKITVGPGWTYHTATMAIPSAVGKTLVAPHGLILLFWLSAGSNFNSRTGNLGPKSGTVVIAGVKMEEGAVATKLVRRSYAEELRLCERYYQKIHVGWVGAGTSAGKSYGSIFNFRTAMRDIPNIVSYVTGGAAEFKAGIPDFYGFYPDLISMYAHQTSQSVGGSMQYWDGTFLLEAEI